MAVFRVEKNEGLYDHVQSPLAQQETIAESKGAPVPHAFAAGGLGLHDQRIGPYLQGRHRRHIHGSKGA